MSKKAQIYAFEIRDLSFEAMNILKQEALSAGGECATPRGCIAHKGEHIALLFATQAVLERIITKLSIQPFGLKTIAKKLADSIHARTYPPSIMAIINATPDSFYEQSRQSAQSAIDRIYTLLQKGIGIIDIGAASSRPGSELIESSHEIARLEPIIEHIYAHNLYKNATFSIDTYNPKTADYALDKGFRIINDVSGLAHDDMPNVAKTHKAQVILMHTKGTPKDMQQLTHTYTHLFGDIDSFFEHKIALLREVGIEDIILDIGFGFAKDDAQNLALIKHLEHFTHFNLPLLVGASRKNTIGNITGKPVQDRLYGTLILHLFALQNGASILRVHDEEAHMDMLKIFEAMQ
ncbi:dihydropteroate synthase [Helicobacter jaachi]|uniref:dihydropteroate synthase n=2 Tax=Helicobacter jaachi TaxID=1677920 RepID=A0A4U8TDB4_9HELI|nr:dihydropteroate synthase [Helicobacter jaachi]